MSDPFKRAAYDALYQTTFDHEDKIAKSLDTMGNKLTDEEKSALFMEQINSKRFMQAMINVLPFYLTWLFSSLLMVNVSIFVSIFNPFFV